MKRFLCLVAVSLLVACGKGMPDPSFVEAPDGKLLVDNPHKVRMMLFRGTPGAETLLGGVPAQATNFRIKAAPGDFVLIAMPVEQYVQHRKAIGNAPMPFSTLVRLGDGETRVTIGTLLGSGGAIRFRNEQAFFVKVLLVDKPAGRTARTNQFVLAPAERRLQNVPIRDYDIFPYALVPDASGTPVPRLIKDSVDMLGVYPHQTNEFVIKAESI